MFKTGPSAAEFLKTALADLRSHAGRSIVIAGETLPPDVHAILGRMNQELGNMGSTVIPVPSIEPRPIDHMAHQSGS